MRLLTAALAALAPSAYAHPGHLELNDSHWHASDAWGFALIGAMVLLAIWLTRGD